MVLLYCTYSYHQLLFLFIFKYFHKTKSNKKKQKTIDMVNKVSKKEVVVNVEDFLQMTSFPNSLEVVVLAVVVLDQKLAQIQYTNWNLLWNNYLMELPKSLQCVRM